jgi:hypothetical protein
MCGRAKEFQERREKKVNPPSSLRGNGGFLIKQYEEKTNRSIFTSEKALFPMETS